MKRLIHTVVVLSVVWTVGAVIHDLTLDTGGDASLEQSAAAYITASGRPASLSEFHGNYLWVDHAAAWCSYCAPQTRTIKALARRYGDRLTFVTVVTGTDKVMESPSAATARDWAERFGLDPDRVLARFGTDTLPHHVLYSPQGEVLFRDSGLYDSDRVIAVLRAKTPVLEP